MTYIDGINAVAMDKFLRALVSGKYVQGKSRLHARADDSMCCLGVATAEVGPECGVRLTDRENTRSRIYEDSEGFLYSLLMPPAVTAYLGVPAQFIDSTGSGDSILVDAHEDDDWDEQDYYNRDGRNLVSVSSLNDSGVPFSTIATRIRETLSLKES